MVTLKRAKQLQANITSSWMLNFSEKAWLGDEKVMFHQDKTPAHQVALAMEKLWDLVCDLFGHRPIGTLIFQDFKRWTKSVELKGDYVFLLINKSANQKSCHSEIVTSYILSLSTALTESIFTCRCKYV